MKALRLVPNLKIAYQHGLACYFGDVVDLNLESVEPKGAAGYAEGTSHLTWEEFGYDLSSLR
jgi:hypothetical protein